MGGGPEAGKNKWDILDNKNFLLLWTGNVTSNVGFSAVGVAYPLVTLLLTNSPVLAGCAAFVGTLPHLLFGIPAGAVADLKDRYRVLLTCQRIGLIATGMAAAATVFRVPDVWLLVFLAAAFVENTGQTFFAVAELAFIRTIVSDEERPGAYALYNVEVRICQMLGRTFGGVFVALARSLPFIANAASYLYCLSTLLAIRHTEPTPTTTSRADRTRLVQWNRPMAGLRLLFAESFLWATAALMGVIEVAFAIAQLQITLEIRAAGGSAALVGVVLGGFGIGGVLGSLVASRLTDRFTVTQLMTWVLGGWAVLLVPVALRADAVVLALSWTGIGAITALAGLAVNLCWLRLIPDDLLGRTESAVMLVMLVGSCVGALLSGVMPRAFGSSTTGWILVAGMGLAAAYARRMREPRTLEMRPFDVECLDPRIARFAGHAEQWVAKVVDATDPIVAKVTSGDRIAGIPSPWARSTAAGMNRPRT